MIMITVLIYYCNVTSPCLELRSMPNGRNVESAHPRAKSDACLQWLHDDRWLGSLLVASLVWAQVTQSRRRTVTVAEMNCSGYENSEVTW
jgi:hypothetical protein